MGQGARHPGGHLGSVRLHRAGQRQPRRESVRALFAQPRRAHRTESGAGTDVRGRVVLMCSQRGRRRADRHEINALRVRRLALTLVATGLVVAAEVRGTLRSAAPGDHPVWQRATVGAYASPQAHEGEPQLSRNSTAPPAPTSAARRFARDYSAWEGGTLATIPSGDATRRVIRLIVQAGRHGPGAAADPTSVRMRPAGPSGYVVTSPIGNFLIARRGSRWLAVSLPGD